MNISTYMFRVRGCRGITSLESDNPKDAWIESRNYVNDEIILFERQSMSILGYKDTEMSIYYHVPIYHGHNKHDMPDFIKRTKSNKNVLQLKLTDLTNIKI